MAQVQGRNLYDVIMFSFLIIEIRKWITLINHWHQLTCTQRCQYTNKNIWYKYGSELLTAWFHTCIVYTATIKWVWEQMSVLTWWRCLLVCVCFMCTLIKQLNEWQPSRSESSDSGKHIVRHDSGRDEWILVDHEVKYGVIQEDQLVSVSAHISWWLDYSSMRQKEVTLFKPLQPDCVCCASASYIATHLYPCFQCCLLCSVLGSCCCCPCLTLPLYACGREAPRSEQCH